MAIGPKPKPSPFLWILYPISDRPCSIAGTLIQSWSSRKSNTCTPPSLCTQNHNTCQTSSSEARKTKNHREEKMLQNALFRVKCKRVRTHKTHPWHQLATHHTIHPTEPFSASFKAKHTYTNTLRWCVFITQLKLPPVSIDWKQSRPEEKKSLLPVNQMKKKHTHTSLPERTTYLLVQKQNGLHLTISFPPS